MQYYSTRQVALGNGADIKLARLLVLSQKRRRRTGRTSSPSESSHLRNGSYEIGASFRLRLRHLRRARGLCRPSRSKAERGPSVLSGNGGDCAQELWWKARQTPYGRGCAADCVEGLEGFCNLGLALTAGSASDFRWRSRFAAVVGSSVVCAGAEVAAKDRQKRKTKTAARTKHIPVD